MRILKLVFVNLIFIQKNKPNISQVRNPENIDQEKIFEVLNQRFQTKFNSWEKKARVLDWANFVVTITVIIIQLFQVSLKVFKN